MRRFRTLTVGVSAAALVLGSVGTAGAAHLPTFPSDPIDDGWTSDRTFPTGGVEVDGDGVLTFSIVADAASSEGGNPQYYRTEGLKRTFDQPFDSVSVDLYLDEEWQNEAKAVRAGMWTADSNGISTYPIIEFYRSSACDADCGVTHPDNLTDFEGFRIWDSIGVGGWKAEVALEDTDVTFGDWVTLTIENDREADRFIYRLNGTQLGSIPSGGDELNTIMLQGLNFGNDPDGPLTGQDYDISWRGAGTGLFDEDDKVHGASDSIDINVDYEEQLSVDVEVTGTDSEGNNLEDGATTLDAGEHGNFTVVVENTGTPRDLWLEDWNLGLDLASLDSLGELDLEFCANDSFTDCTNVDNYADVELEMTDGGVVQILGSDEAAIEPGFSQTFYFRAAFENEGQYTGNVYALQQGG